MTVAGQTRRLAAGAAFIVPPDAQHGVVALEAGLLVDVFTPQREDFLRAARLAFQRVIWMAPMQRGESEALLARRQAMTRPPPGMTLPHKARKSGPQPRRRMASSWRGVSWTSSIAGALAGGRRRSRRGGSRRGRSLCSWSRCRSGRSRWRQEPVRQEPVRDDVVAAGAAGAAAAEAEAAETAWRQAGDRAAAFVFRQDSAAAPPGRNAGAISPVIRRAGRADRRDLVMRRLLGEARSAKAQNAACHQPNHGQGAKIDTDAGHGDPARLFKPRRLVQLEIDRLDPRLRREGPLEGIEQLRHHRQAVVAPDIHAGIGRELPRHRVVDMALVRLRGR